MEFIGLKELNGQIYIVMEFMNNGSLLDYIRKQEYVKEHQIISMAVQIALGMSYLEERGIVHKFVFPTCQFLIWSIYFIWWK